MFHKKSLVSDFFRPELFHLSCDRCIPGFPARPVTDLKASDNPQAFNLSCDSFQTAKRKGAIWLHNFANCSRIESENDFHGGFIQNTGCVLALGLRA